MMGQADDRTVRAVVRNASLLVLPILIVRADAATSFAAPLSLPARYRWQSVSPGPPGISVPRWHLNCWTAEESEVPVGPHGSDKDAPADSAMSSSDRRVLSIDPMTGRESENSSWLYQRGIPK